MGYFKRRKRIKALLKADDERIRFEQLKAEKEQKFKEEISTLTAKDIQYLKKLAEVNLSAKDINLATLIREFNRVMHSLYAALPTLYLEVFKAKPNVIFDTVYIRNGEGSSYGKSLSDIEIMLADSCKKENWPPKKIDFDYIEDACYYVFTNELSDKISKLTKLLSLINSYS